VLPTSKEQEHAVEITEIRAERVELPVPEPKGSEILVEVV
jgi:hypothetical protein